jgi:ribosomal protein L14
MGTEFYKAPCSNLWSGCTAKKKFLTFSVLLVLAFFSANSQTNLSFTQLSGDFPAPGRGAQNWGLHTWNDITQPTIPSGNSVAKNYYTRFNWLDIESNTSQGTYNWTVFDNFVKQAMNAGAMFTFGLMPFCDGCGAGGAIPQYVVNLMAAEGKPGWNNGGVMYPNYQSTQWANRYIALMQAVANHIASTSYNGHTYTSAFLGYDLRHYGNFGEGWAIPADPTAQRVTDAYLINMTDAAIATFPNVQLTIPFEYVVTNNNWGAANGHTDVQAAYHVLTSSNNYGRIGWRRDNLGDDGYNVYVTSNSASYNSVALGPLAQNMWQFAPIGGEPSSSQGGVSRCGTIYCDLHNENVLFHMSYFGNGNAPGNVSNTAGAVWSQLQTNWRAASAEQGYKLVLSSGSMTTTLSSGGPFNVTVNWRNIGIAPVYEKWNVTYELRNSSGTVVWTGNSAFTPRLFLPQATATSASDNFTLSTVPSGTYSLYMVVRDPLNYKAPLPLAITGRGADGSYLIRSNITVGTGGPVNQAPTANAGADKTIQLPTALVSLTGTGTDADGTIATYTWTKLSGPASGVITTPALAATSITGLVQGVYVYTLTVTDNQGASASDNVQITVNAAIATNLPPVVNAGINKTIQLPTNSVALTGSATDADGTITSYTWTKLSGPASGTIASPAAASTNITGLVQGVYDFTCTATDNSGATGNATVQITVNAATATNQPPVVSAGVDKSIQLPTNTVSLTGTATDPDGTIASYAWAKLSGPASGSITTPGSANTTMTGLVQGVYVYTFTVTDNQGAASIDYIQVTVNAATANQPPVAKAGSDVNMTLPTNTANLNGSASSDADGSITAFLWTKISGPAQFTIGNTTAASTIVNNLTAGVYSFQLKVTDNAGAIALDTIKIIENAAPVNQPPVANAGADLTITLPTNVVNLNGSASTDADGTVTSYAWTQVSGPTTASIGSAGSASSSVSGLQQGSYTFALKVTDNSGATNLDSLKVTVNAAANILPVANAGTSKTITLPVNSTSLNGSASTDADGTITAYGWAQISGPSSANMTGSTQAIANVTNMLAGVYNFELTVTDNRGGTSKAGVKITVIAATLQAPVANAGADQTITLPTNTATINGSGSSAPSGTIVSYTWTEKSGPSPVSLSNTVQNNLNNLSSGKYVFYLTVKDNNGSTASDSVSILVNPATNQAPIANAGTGITLVLPVNSTALNGTGSSDPDGTISSYNWTRISGPSTPVITGANTATANISGLLAGIYYYQLTVIDNKGASSSAQVKVIVSTATNILPVANAGINQSITSPVSTVNLDGSASNDPDGSIVSFSWVTISGPGSISISNSNTSKPSVTGLQTGSYIFELTVTDNRGASTKDQVNITVLPALILPNQAPVANAGNNNFTITLPTNSVNFDGSSSFDPDGTIVAYSWKNVSGPSVAVMTGANTVSPTASQLTVGAYVFELTVTDNNGATNVDNINVTVNPSVSKVNQPPVANAGDQNPSIVLPVNSVTLDGSKSYDPDGTIVSYSWKNNSGPSQATLNGINTATLLVTGLQTGTYVFQLTVTDDKGATNIDYVNVIVSPASSGNSISLDRLTMYPNPAHSVINGRVTSPIMGTVKISVYDMNGRLVYSAEEQKTTDVMNKSMNISTLASGLYSVVINIANRTTIVSKFIKN